MVFLLCIAFVHLLAMDLMMSRKEFEELLNINHESERDKRNYLAFYDNDPSYER